MRKKLNPPNSEVDSQEVIGPHPLTGHNVVIINSVELNILFGKKAMTIKITLRFVMCCCVMMEFCGCATSPQRENRQERALQVQEVVYSDAFYSRSQTEAVNLARTLKARFGGDYHIIVGTDSDSDYTLPRIEKESAPRYPEALQAEHIEGVVSVAGIVDATGAVIEAAVAQSTDHRFDAAAVEALKLWKFRPARYRGKPVRHSIEVPFWFIPKQ